MKFIVLVVVIAVVLWLMSSRRRSVKDERTQRPNAAPEAMVQCAHCDVHLPRSDALAGADGRLYCCQAHRIAQEATR